MKIRLVFFLFIFLFTAIIIKLFFLQVLTPYQTNKLGGNLNKIIPERGVIYDRNMNPLALNQNKYRLFAEPKKIKDKDLIANTIGEISNIDIATIEARIDDSKDWVSITSGIDKSVKEQIIASGGDLNTIVSMLENPH